MSKAPKGLRRAGFGGLTAAVALGTLVASSGIANATSSFDLTRLAGQAPNADRYGTSAKIADTYKTVNGAVSDVILAGASADALTGGVLAGVKGAPILVTQRDATPDIVKKAIAASGAKNIWIIGGTARVSQAQEDALRAAGYTVTRINKPGGDRYSTAKAVIAAAGSSLSKVGLVANGDGFADALAASPLSYAGKHGLFLVHKDSIPTDTLQAMKDSGITSVLVLGGDAAVSPSVRAQITAAGYTIITSFPGKDRSDTSQLIAQYEIDNAGFGKTAFHLATGKQSLNGVDALSAGPLAGSVKQPLLLTDSLGGIGSVDDFAVAHKADLSGTGF
ncbi:MAG: cell wall-binding repeat-containing protein, partial [Actinomycetes bacterium]